MKDAFLFRKKKVFTPPYKRLAEKESTYVENHAIYFFSYFRTFLIMDYVLSGIVGAANEPYHVTVLPSILSYYARKASLLAVYLYRKSCKYWDR